MSRSGLGRRLAALGLWAPAMLLAPVVVVSQDRLVGLESELLYTASCGFVPLLVLGVVTSVVVPLASVRLVSVVLSGLATLTLLSQVAQSPTRTRSPAAGPNLVLITLDTFRADHLARLGGAAPTPNLDKLCADGALFTQALSPFPLTAPAHATLLTGTVRHSLRANGGHLSEPTVVPALAEAGYRTGAFVSAPVLDRYTGLHRGFLHYDDRFGTRARFEWLLGPGPVSPRAGDETVSRALEWLREESDPAFLWIHLYDPHSPYLPPRGWLPDKAARDAAKEADRQSRRDLDKRSFTHTLEAGFVASQKLMYRAEITWTDHLVGVITAALPPETVLVVVGDHGESLDEHQYAFNHGRNLFDPSLHVPLILRWPGKVAAGIEERRLVGLTTVAPTLRLAAGLEPEGETLLDRLDPAAPTSQIEAFTPGMEAHRAASGGEAGPVAALRGEGFKLVVERDGESWYDLVVDPGEMLPQPVPSAQQHLVAPLRARVDEPLPKTAPERLLSLGYVE